MSKIEFVIHCIQHHEDFPDVGEIGIETAEVVVSNVSKSKIIPSMTASEFMEAWNVFVHDPKVMHID